MEENDFDELIIGVTPDQLCRAERRLSVAGRPSNRVIRAALIVGWINILITDSVTRPMAAALPHGTELQPDTQRRPLSPRRAASRSDLISAAGVSDRSNRCGIARDR
ncbi:hypothetical protein ACVBEQ_17050 [Nakamurella sp. GG22]